LIFVLESFGLRIARVGPDTEGDILSNYDSSDILMGVAKGVMALHIILAYPVILYPARRILRVWVFRSPDMPLQQVPFWRHTFQTAVIISFTALIAILLPQVSVVFGLLGASSSTALAVVLPAFMVLSQHGLRAGLSAKTSFSPWTTLTPTDFHPDPNAISSPHLASAEAGKPIAVKTIAESMSEVVNKIPPEPSPNGATDVEPVQDEHPLLDSTPRSSGTVDAQSSESENDCFSAELDALPQRRGVIWCSYISIGFGIVFGILATVVYMIGFV